MYTINTAIEQFFDEFEVLINKIKEIRNIFAYSSQAVRDLRAKQVQLNQKTDKIPSYCKTRWWSLLNLLKVVSGQKAVLNEFLEEYKKGKYANYILDAKESRTLRNLVSILENIQDVVEKLSSESKVTASMNVPLYFIFEKLIENFNLEGSFAGK